MADRPWQHICHSNFDSRRNLLLKREGKAQKIFHKTPPLRKRQSKNTILVDSIRYSTSGYLQKHNIVISSTLLMPWPFCPSCRSTLKVDRTGSIECNVCPYRSNLNEFSNDDVDDNIINSGRPKLPSTITYSADRPIPLWAKTDKEQQALKRSSQEPTRATIEEPCIKCSHPIVGYYTVQLRSVDEGQTVFYECPNCKHTWSINN